MHLVGLCDGHSLPCSKESTLQPILLARSSLTPIGHLLQTHTWTLFIIVAALYGQPQLTTNTTASTTICQTIVRTSLAWTAHATGRICHGTISAAKRCGDDVVTVLRISSMTETMRVTGCYRSQDLPHQPLGLTQCIAKRLARLALQWRMSFSI